MRYFITDLELIIYLALHYCILKVNLGDKKHCYQIALITLYCHESKCHKIQF